jgi:hypothetical protein
MAGRVLSSGEWDAAADNRYGFSNDKLQLKPGLYILRISQRDYYQTFKLVKK